MDLDFIFSFTTTVLSSFLIEKAALSWYFQVIMVSVEAF